MSLILRCSLQTITMRLLLIDSFLTFGLFALPTSVERENVAIAERPPLENSHILTIPDTSGKFEVAQLFHRPKETMSYEEAIEEEVGKESEFDWSIVITTMAVCLCFGGMGYSIWKTNSGDEPISTFRCDLTDRRKENQDAAFAMIRAIEGLGEVKNESTSRFLSRAVAIAREAVTCDRVILYQVGGEGRGTVVAESVNTSYTRAVNQFIEDPCFEREYRGKYDDGRISFFCNIERTKITQCHRDQLNRFEVKANMVAGVRQCKGAVHLLIFHHCRKSRKWSESNLAFARLFADYLGSQLDDRSLERYDDSLRAFKTLATANITSMRQHIALVVEPLIRVKDALVIHATNASLINLRYRSMLEMSRGLDMSAELETLINTSQGQLKDLTDGIDELNRKFKEFGTEKGSSEVEQVLSSELRCLEELVEELYEGFGE